MADAARTMHDDDRRCCGCVVCVCFRIFLQASVFQKLHARGSHARRSTPFETAGACRRGGVCGGVAGPDVCAAADGGAAPSLRMDVCGHQRLKDRAS